MADVPVEQRNRKQHCVGQIHGHVQVDVAKSLPEFENLPTPDDATVLKFSPDGQYDAAASMDEAEDVPAMEAANAAA